MAKERVRLFAKMDTDLLLDARYVAAGPEAFTLFWKCVLHSKLHLADGYVPKDAVTLLGVGLKSPTKAAAALVASGLWVLVEGGYATAEGWWEREQTTAEQVEAKRDADAERKRKERERRQGEKERLRTLESQGSHEVVTRDKGCDSDGSHGDVTASSRKGTEHRAQSTDISPKGDMDPAPAPVLEWGRRVSGIWGMRGDEWLTERVVPAIEAFESFRMGLRLGVPSPDVVEPFLQAIEDRKPAEAQIEGFLREIVRSEIQTPNAKAFHRWLDGTFVPKGGRTQGTGNSGGNSEAPTVPDPDAQERALKAEMARMGR